MKNIAFFLLFFLLVSGYSNANPVGGSIGGWNVVSNVASGVGAKITATKDVLVNGAKTTITGTANIIPDASNMGKFMARLGGAAVVSEVVNQLLNGVDYVMDPVNNTITYNKKSDGNVVHNYDQYRYFITSANTYVSSLDAFAKIRNLYFSDSVATGCTVEFQNGLSMVTCLITNKTSGASGRFVEGYREANPIYNPNVDNPTKPVTVPVTDVATQVLDQAEKDIKAGNVASPAVTLSRAVAQDMVQEAEADDVKARPIAQQLETNSSYPSETDVEGEITTPEVTDPTTGEVVKPAETSSIAMQFPKACEWFPQLCLFIDWMQKPQELDEPDLPTKEIEKKEIDEELIKISSSSCPAPIDVNIPLPVFNTTYTDSISVSEYCPKIEKLAPVLQLLAFVLAIMIIKDI